MRIGRLIGSRRIDANVVSLGKIDIGDATYAEEDIWVDQRADDAERIEHAQNMRHCPRFLFCLLLLEAWDK